MYEPGETIIRGVSGECPDCLLYALECPGTRERGQCNGKKYDTDSPEVGLKHARHASSEMIN